MRRKFLLTIMICIVIGTQSYANGDVRHQVNFSITLSGHLLFGAGYTFWINDDHAFEATVYPIMVPGKGLPFALSAGYGFYPGNEHWKAKLGTDLTFIVSPPDPDKRKTMPLLSFTPGVYYQSDNNSFQSEIWYSWFLKGTNKKSSFTGIELKYGRFIEE